MQEITVVLNFDKFEESKVPLGQQNDNFNFT